MNLSKFDVSRLARLTNIAKCEIRPYVTTFRSCQLSVKRETSNLLKLILVYFVWKEYRELKISHGDRRIGTIEKFFTNSFHEYEIFFTEENSFHKKHEMKQNFHRNLFLLRYFQLKFICTLCLTMVCISTIVQPKGIRICLLPNNLKGLC